MALKSISSVIIASNMAGERLLRTIHRLESKMAASTPEWNVQIERGRRGLIQLKSRVKESGEFTLYPIGVVSFFVLDLVVKGCSNREISSFLGTRPQTIKHQLQHLGEKFDVYYGRIPLIKKLVEEGVLSFEPRVPSENWVGIKSQ